tara:strand:+ start:2051 stop:2683 length:633 start_codon:yes stop_codon:yes gene_type:complete
MSIEMMNGAWNTDGLTPTKKLILLLLGSYADENGQCYPSHRHIANKIGLKDTKGIGATIREFEKLGYLRIEHRKKADGGYTSNKYTLLLPKGATTPRGAKGGGEGVQNTQNTKEDTKTKYIEETFDQFWEYYPRKVAKKKAFQIYQKLKKEDILKVLSSVKLLSKNVGDINFTPYPATWLNQERWNDEVTQSNKKSYKDLDRSSDWAKDL